MASSRIFGNRPDCAYYLMLGLCAAAVFVAFGGIFTYMGYWPELAFSHPREAHNYLTHTPNNPDYYKYETISAGARAYAVLGPLCIVLGLAIALTVGVLGIKYDCEYEPEEPKVAIMRLASEMSLNMEGGGYEAVRSVPGTSASSAVPSSSGSSAGNNVNVSPREQNVV